MHELIGLAAIALGGAAAAPPARGGVDEGRHLSTLTCAGKDGTVDLALTS